MWHTFVDETHQYICRSDQREALSYPCLYWVPEFSQYTISIHPRQTSNGFEKYVVLAVAVCDASGTLARKYRCGRWNNSPSIKKTDALHSACIAEPSKMEKHLLALVIVFVILHKLTVSLIFFAHIIPF